MVTEDARKIKYKNILKAILFENKTFQDAAIEQGYSETTSRTPDNITRTKLWKECLNELDDSSLLGKLWEIAFDTDKRSALEAVDKLLKLKDKYPAKKLKLEEYSDELKELEEDETSGKENTGKD